MMTTVARPVPPPSSEQAKPSHKKREPERNGQILEERHCAIRLGLPPKRLALDGALARRQLDRRRRSLVDQRHRSHHARVASLARQLQRESDKDYVLLTHNRIQIHQLLDHWDLRDGWTKVNDLYGRPGCVLITRRQ